MTTPLDYHSVRPQLRSQWSPGRLMLWFAYFICWAISTIALTTTLLIAVWEALTISQRTRLDDDISLIAGVVMGLIGAAALGWICRGRPACHFACILVGSVVPGVLLGYAESIARSPAFLSDLAAMSFRLLAAVIAPLCIAGGLGLLLCRRRNASLAEYDSL